MTANGVVENARREGRTVLTEIEAKKLLSNANVPVVEATLARSPGEAAAAADEIGYPVALKVVSPQITHKSDVGGVKLGLANADDVRKAYEAIVAAATKAEPGARVDGVSVQRMAEPGTEVIVGMTTDAQFGPVLMFGLGGVLVEVLKDVAFRIVPLEPRDAAQMVRDIRGFPVLEGYRGQPPVDLAALEALLLQISSFIEEHPEISELDLNPVFAYEKGSIAVDARIVLKETST